jgi:hypothetical protein
MTIFLKKETFLLISLTPGGNRPASWGGIIKLKICTLFVLPKSMVFGFLLTNCQSH